MDSKLKLVSDAAEQYFNRLKAGESADSLDSSMSLFDSWQALSAHERVSVCSSYYEGNLDAKPSDRAYFLLVGRDKSSEQAREIARPSDITERDIKSISIEVDSLIAQLEHSRTIISDLVMKLKAYQAKEDKPSESQCEYAFQMDQTKDVWTFCQHKSGHPGDHNAFVAGVESLEKNWQKKEIHNESTDNA